jgi:Icc-related predicted phosphoesterase
MGLFRKGAPRRRGHRILFATDIHGSDECFRKFVNAPPIYDVDTLILGGDVTGKMMVPIIKEGASYRCAYGDNTYADLSEQGRNEVVKLIRRSGHYPIVLTPDEQAELVDPERQDALFRKAVIGGIESWVELAEERLKPLGIKMFVAPGNDDFLEIDSALQGSDTVIFAEDRCLPIDTDHEMITTGYSNPTPWKTERELEEPELRLKIDRMAAEVENPDRLIAVIHPPPLDSDLDIAPELDEEFGIKMQRGVGVLTMPVGSSAVREFLEQTQPLLSLHGHVHDSAGATMIGRTLAINPGSSYTEGLLQGVVVEIDGDEVLSHQFVNG